MDLVNLCDSDSDGMELVSSQKGSDGTTKRRPPVKQTTAPMRQERKTKEAEAVVCMDLAADDSDDEEPIKGAVKVANSGEGDALAKLSRANNKAGSYVLDACGCRLRLHADKLKASISATVNSLASEHRGDVDAQERISQPSHTTATSVEASPYPLPGASEVGKGKGGRQAGKRGRQVHQPSCDEVPARHPMGGSVPGDLAGAVDDGPLLLDLCRCPTCR